MVNGDDLVLVLAEQVRGHEESGCEDKERDEPHHDSSPSLSGIGLRIGIAMPRQNLGKSPAGAGDQRRCRLPSSFLASNRARTRLSPGGAGRPTQTLLIGQAPELTGTEAKTHP